MARENERGRVKEAITAAGLAGLTVKELQERLGLSESCIRRHLAKLKEEDWVRTESLARGGRVGRPTKVFIDRSVK